MSDSYRLPFDEAVDRLNAEFEGACEAARSGVKGAAHWWTTIIGLRADPHTDTLLIEVDPDYVGHLLRNYFEEVVECDVRTDPEAFSEYWRLLCPSTAEVLLDEQGECTEVVITEHDVRPASNS